MKTKLFYALLLCVPFCLATVPAFAQEATPAPVAPAAPKVTAASKITVKPSYQSVEVKFTPVANHTYELVVTEAKEGVAPTHLIPASTVDPKKLPLTVYGLKPGITYKLVVKATVGVNSAESGEIEFTTNKGYTEKEAAFWENFAIGLGGLNFVDPGNKNLPFGSAKRMTFVTGAEKVQTDPTSNTYVVKVNKRKSSDVKLLLEAHVLPIDMGWIYPKWFDGTKAGFFVATQADLTGMGFGVMISYREDDKKQSFNLGYGQYTLMNQSVLKEGFSEGSEVLAHQTIMEERDLLAELLILSFSAAF